jgi:hypothetical protein
MSTEPKPFSDKAVKAICFSAETGLVFFRDSADEVFVMGKSSSHGAPIMNADTPIESVLDFIHRFPDCVRCVPLKQRRRRAIKGAMKLIEMGAVPARDKI